MLYEVIVGNIGTVCRTESSYVAHNAYRVYMNASMSNSGRAAGESVTIMFDGVPIREHIGTLDKGGK